jgi:hypothetical protein
VTGVHNPPRAVHSTQVGARHFKLQESPFSEGACRCKALRGRGRGRHALRSMCYVSISTGDQGLSTTHQGAPHIVFAVQSGSGSGTGATALLIYSHIDRHLPSALRFYFPREKQLARLAPRPTNHEQQGGSDEAASRKHPALPAFFLFAFVRFTFTSANSAAVEGVSCFVHARVGWGHRRPTRSA